MIALCFSCGPIGATAVIDDADIAVSRAHGADGEKLAPYETTLADLYLVKAKEEQGHARYADAMELGQAAVKFAEQATRKAAEKRTGPVSPPAPGATIQHPGEKP